MGKETDEMPENANSAFEDNQEISLDEREEDFDQPVEDTPDEPSFMELYEQSLKTIHEGKVLNGEIVQIDKEYVLVDIGYKSEGQIRINEFINMEGELTAKVGDQVEVLLVRKENKEGRIILSKEKAAKVKVWDNVEEAYKNQNTIPGTITSRMKGGLCVDIGLQAFLPGSQADLRPVRDLDTLVGKEFEFKVVKFEKRQGNIVLSRRAALEAERKALREKTIEQLEKDAVLEGIVSNITRYGLFIDLGGIDGLVHVTDLSWSKVGNPSELYQIGDKITVKVLSFDKERERVSLGIKQLTPDPWSNAQEKYPAGTRITGRVETLKDYGAFVELEKGIEGLIHVSEMSWTRNIKHPSQVLNVGNDVEALVLSLDVSKKRISLSIKQIKPNPWDIISENYPVGAIIEGKIKNITDFGIFIGIDEGIDGLVHISDFSWSKKINHPAELYKKGDEIQAVILDIDRENERFSLGIKQLTPDPWDEIPEKYPRGTIVEGTVKSVTDFGIFVELEAGIEGLIHISQLPKGKSEKLLNEFKVDDEIQAQVVNVSQEDKKIGLSIRKLEENKEKQMHKSYGNNQKQATSNLGELLKEKMMTTETQAAEDSQETDLEEAADSSPDALIEPPDDSSADPQS
ncbi:30S ribosomal protein S1 [Thermodesulfobacteriota bacterium]